MRGLPTSCYIVVVFATILSACASVEPFVGSDKDLGVVLMHGTGGTPGGALAGLAGALSRAGIPVETPEMPWSRSRKYAKSYEEAMGEIDSAVQRLKDQGAKRIVIGGHSLGANAAVGYAARRDKLAGVIVLGPGHHPGRSGFQSKTGFSYLDAKKMFDAGRGESMGSFAVIVQGRKSIVKAKAGVFLSYFDPTGSAVWDNNISQMDRKTPLLWVVGENDEFAARSSGRYPKNDKEVVFIISGGHSETPNGSIDIVADWLRSLKCEELWCGGAGPSGLK